MSLFREFAEELGIEVHMDRLFEILYNKALNGDADCGGLFKTKGVGQGILAAAINAPVSVMETAGESGPWGNGSSCVLYAAKGAGGRLL